MIHKKAPSSAYALATYCCIGLSAGAYLTGISKADIQLNEQGYYLICLLFGLFASIVLQKVVRDKEDGQFVSNKFRAISVFAMASSLLLFVVGLYNADFSLSEKGFYAMSYILAMFSTITAQKNEADKRELNKSVEPSEEE